MGTIAKKTFKLIFLALIALYLALFAGRAVYELTREVGSDVYYGYWPGSASLVRNFASTKLTMDAIATPGSSGAVVIDQKYERIAHIASKTSDFDSDLKRLNNLLDEYNAIVQMENNRGLPGNRQIDLVIGVRPEIFDAIQAKISQIGQIISVTITKTDKTDDYLQMLANKEALERRLASYEELKAHGGSVSELLQLEERIFDVEAQIQRQLIGLSSYSNENALCTINFSLYERTGLSVFNKLWNALTWTTGTYCIIIAVLMLTILSAAVIAWGYNSLKRIITEKP